MTSDLKELFDVSGRSAPSTSGWDLDELMSRGRRRRNIRRGLTAVGALATATALFLGATAVIPKRNAEVTPIGSPTNTSHDMVEGLEFTVTGPAILNMRDQYTVSMTVKNTTTTEFRGGVGAALVRSTDGKEGGNLLQFSNLMIDQREQQDSSATTEVGQLIDGRASEAFLTWDRGDAAVGNQTTIAPGQSIQVSFTVQRVVLSESLEQAVGWIPAVKSIGKPTSYAPSSGHAAVTAVPVVGDPQCSSVHMNHTSVLSSRWRLNTVATNFAEASGAGGASSTGTQGWTYPLGRGSKGFGSGFAPGNGSYPVDLQLLRSSLVAAGIYLAGPDAWTDPALGLNPSKFTGMPYIAYNGAEFIEVAYEGTCTPSGEVVSGTFVGAGRPSNGFMPCNVGPDTGSLAIHAAVYCPVGSVAKSQSRPDGFTPGALGIAIDPSLASTSSG